MPINKNVKLYFYKNGTRYYNLLEDNDLLPSMENLFNRSFRIYVSGKSYYVPASSGALPNNINFKKGDNIYHCVLLTPTLTITYEIKTTVGTYGEYHYLMTVKTASISILSNTGFDFYLSKDNSNYIKIGSLDKKTRSVQLDYSLNSDLVCDFYIQTRAQKSTNSLLLSFKYSITSDGFNNIITFTNANIKNPLGQSAVLPGSNQSIKILGRFWVGVIPYTTNKPTIISSGQSSMSRDISVAYGIGATSVDVIILYDDGESEIQIYKKIWIVIPSVRTDEGTISFNATYDGSISINTSNITDPSTTTKTFDIPGNFY